MIAAAFLVLALSLYVLAPVLRQGVGDARAEVATGQRRYQDLAARRDQLIHELRELQLDAELGKLDGDEYAADKAPREVELAGVLHELDDLAGSDPAAGDGDPDGEPEPPRG